MDCESIAGVFCDTRTRTEALAAPLSAEDQTAQSMADTSPTKWHRAHTTWFFETFVLERFAPHLPPFDPTYRSLFNSYYESVGPRFPRPQRGMVTRPGAEEIGEYRRHVDRHILGLIGDRGDFLAELTELVELGVHHEQQHQELILMDAEHLFSLNPLRPVYREGRRPARPAGPDHVDLHWVDVAGGFVDVGQGSGAFCYDNETPRHPDYVAPFRLADRLVTNGEWQDFIDDGGYHRSDLWLSDGWYFVQEHGVEAPIYWRPDGMGWAEHTLHGTRSVEPDEPVCHVSFYEADAFARWAGARLPTEFEWEVAAATAPLAPQRAFDLDGLRPAPAPSGDGTSLRQMFGECWQWTASAYLPYPGFRPAAGAVGEYNGKFMSGQMVLRGSSAYTPPGHSRLTYRNFFPPSSRWPLTGLRLAG